jgi:phosphomannomutase/phosphoglucomutase
MSEPKALQGSNKEGELITNVLFLIGAIGALTLVFFASHALWKQYSQHHLESRLQSEAQAIYQQVNQNLLQVQGQLDRAIAETFGEPPAYDPEKKEALEQQLASQLKDSLRVKIIDQPLSTITPQPGFPQINFATLDMLNEAEQTGKSPLPEIHLYGQKEQYLNFVRVIDPERKIYLLSSFPVDPLLKNLDKSGVDKGQITLMQNAGKYSNVSLLLWGKASAASHQSHKLKVPGSYFQVGYRYDRENGVLMDLPWYSLLIGSLAGLVAFGGLTLLFWRNYQERLQARHDHDDYVPIKTAKPAGPAGTLTHDDDDEDFDEEIEDNTPSPSGPVPSMQNSAVDPSIFRAYDIRGIVDESLTEDTVRLIGQAIGSECLDRGGQEIVVARDGRISGPRLQQALIEGINAAGCDVIDIGAVPTGVLYFATHHLDTGSGVMVTGSHNPPNYNGLKTMLLGDTLAGDDITHLYQRIVDGRLHSGSGRSQKMDIEDDYIDFVSSDIQLENSPKVVVDCGNGIGGALAPQLLEEIGCEVVPLHCEVDGNFPNHHPDPSVPANLEDLITTVKAMDADIGIAFDGDADRLGVVSKDGEIIYSDRLLMLFAKDVLTRQPGSAIIFDVKCTGHLPKWIVQYGGMPVMWKTGHSFMKTKLKETGAALAGEMSGHFFFKERWFGFDDGIYAAARLLEILDQEDRTPEEVFAELPKGVSTPELKVEMAEGEHYAFMQEFQEKAEFPDAHITTIDGIRADFSDGWGLVRCSNTTPCLVLRFDADNEDSLKRIQEEFRAQLLKLKPDLPLPF